MHLFFFSSVNELYTDRRTECIQETINKSVHPIREYIVIEEFVKTMEIEEVTEMFYLLLINCSVSYISTGNTLS